MNLAELLLDPEERRSRTNRVYGVVSGIVTDNHDPEGRARVKINFPWLAEHAESDWAKVASLMAGKDRGTCFLPEVGDEVLVAFERGDLDHPFIVGYLWNGVDVPPETDPENRIIFTPGKHTLRFEDKNQKIILKSAGGHEVVIDDSANTLTLQTNGGQSIVLSDNPLSSITLKGGGRQIQMSTGQVQIT